MSIEQGKEYVEATMPSETVGSFALSTLEILPTLPDIDEVEPMSEKDRACVADIRAVLEKHGALSRFGISLLHEHFDIGDDEVMVESVDKENRVLTTRPVKMADHDAVNSIETNWRLDSVTGLARCERQCVFPYGPKGPHIMQHFMVG
jgi:hypothetical protein